jgi:hypothetical protein
MTLRAELTALYNRLTNPNRLCDECGLPPMDGERGGLTTVRLPFGHLVYSICGRCKRTGTPNIRKEAERIVERFISESAMIFLEPKETGN